MTDDTAPANEPVPEPPPTAGDPSPEAMALPPGGDDTALPSGGDDPGPPGGRRRGLVVGFAVGLALVLGAVSVLLVVGAAGRNGKKDNGVATAGGTPSHSSGASPAASWDGGVQFAKCMRENGVPDFPDPQVDGNGAGGGIRMAVPDGADRQKVQTATEKCRQFMPNGGQPPKMSAEQLEQARKMSQCMREHGITNFPDPQADGGIMITQGPDSTDMNPDNPKFKAADQACSQYRPSGGPGGGHVEGPK